VIGYPHHLAGAPAPPPAPVPPRVLAMAVKAHGKHLTAVRDRLVTAAPWRRAYSLDVLVAEADATAPTRNRASDGSIGDTRHQAENGPHGPGSGSDHNPWVILAGVGIVRAEDLTNDPALNLPAAFERMRAAAAAGRLPQLPGGGYAILNGRITREDWSGWAQYKGADPHVSHGHVSVSLDAARFDSRAGWGLFIPEQAPPPTPPPPPVPAGWTGPDLVGAGAGLRGQAAGQPSGPQSNGPRVAALQTFLRDRYSLYAKTLQVDGWYGQQTAGVLAEFAHRSGIPAADGLNIGPKLAAALAAAGFGQRTAARPTSARDRVRGHLDRTARR
jgi:hypothetical protein